MALQKAVVSIPVSQGLDTKTDSKQVMSGRALVLENARFQKVGKLSKRFGLVAIGETIDSGGNLSDYVARNIVSDDTQINVLNSDGIYQKSFSSEWTKTSDFKHPTSIRTEFVSKTNRDNFRSDFDYDDTFKTWATVTIGTLTNFSVTPYLAITIKNVETGYSKSIRIGAVDADDPSPRVIATNNGADLRIFAFYKQSGNLLLSVYDQTMSLISSSTVISAVGSSAQIDACKDSSNVYLLCKSGTNLRVFKYALSGSLSLSNTITTATLSTRSSAPLGFSVSLSGSTIHCAWSTSSGNDLALIGIETTNLTTFIPQLVDTVTEPPYTITTLESDGILYVLYGNDSTSGSATVYACVIRQYTFSASGYVFTEQTSSGRLTPLSKPFTLGGNVIFPVMCNESEQRTGFLADSSFKPILSFSPFQIARSIADTSLSYDGYSIPKSFTSSDGVAYFAFERIYQNPDSVDEGEFIDTRGLSVSTVTVPSLSNTGSRAKIGESIYFTSGLTFEFDGRKPHENGFALGPWIYGSTSTTGGSLPAGTYRYIGVYEYYDRSGQRSISQLSNQVTVTTTGSTSLNTIEYFEPVLTYKGSSNNSTDNIRVNFVLYRTENNGSVFYRVRSLETGIFGGGNSLTDTILDAALTSNEQLYTTGGVLENNQAPAGTFSFAGGSRYFVGGLENDDEVAFSKKQLFGQSVAFNTLQKIRVPVLGSDTSRVSAGAYMDGKIIFFRSRSIYFSQGDGPNNVGVGAFSDPEPISTDAGCSNPRSVLNTPSGIMFKSQKGIYLLSRGLSVEYVGSDVEEFNQYEVVSSILSEDSNEARFYLESGDCLVYNYFFGTWSVFKNQTTVDTDLWAGSPCSIIENTPFREDNSSFHDDGVYYSMKFTSPWLKINLVQGYQRCYKLWIIGDYKSPHTLKCRVYTDYDDSQYDDYDLVYDSSQSPQYQFQISLPRQKVESIKFEIYDTDQSGSGESFDLSNIQAEVGVKSGGYKLGSSKSY
jgi:hypothetical protein